MKSNVLVKVISYWERRYQLQKFWFRLLGAEVGEGNTFNDWIKIAGQVQNLKIGDNNVFNQNLVFNLDSNITIGDRNHFSVGVVLITTKLNDLLNSHVKHPIVIGDDNWFAACSVIAISHGELVVSDGIVLGAQSLLCKSTSLPGLYAGVPATFRRSLFSKAQD